MNADRVILVIAALAAFSALLSAGFTYYSISAFRDSMFTGFASQTNATINLTVNSVLSVNFTNNTINWGAGYVNPGATYANLTTGAGDTITAQFGTWTIVGANGSGGFVVENIGNLNASLHILTYKTAAQLLGGTSPHYQFNVTNIEASSCLNYSGGTTALGSTGLQQLGVFNETNTTAPGTSICGLFPYRDSSDTIRIDMRLTVPYDSLNGSLSDIVTVSYCAWPGPCS